jgi:hypothetical protein
MRYALLIVALLCCGLAWSENPYPTPREKSQHQENSPQKRGEKGKSEQRGTDNLPLVIKILPPEKTESIATKNPANIKESAPANWTFEIGSAIVTAVATAVIAWFTVALARSTKKLWAAGERQAQLARDEFEFTKKQLKDATNLAERQMLLTGMQTDCGRRCQPG